MEWLRARGTSRLIGAPCRNWTRWSVTRGPWTMACKVAKCIAVIASHRRWGFAWIPADIHQIQVHRIRSRRCGCTIGKMGQSCGGIGRGEWMVKLPRVLWGSLPVTRSSKLLRNFMKTFPHPSSRVEEHNVILLLCPGNQRHIKFQREVSDELIDVISQAHIFHWDLGLDLLVLVNIFSYTALAR